MDPRSDEQTELLRSIWNEMKALGQNLGGRIDQTNLRLDAVGAQLGQRIDRTNERLEVLGAQLGQRIDQTNQRIDALRTDFGRALGEVQTRLGTELAALAEAVQGVNELLRSRVADRDRLKDCEEDIADLKERLGRLEEHAGA